jgi:hypothetical protein
VFEQEARLLFRQHIHAVEFDHIASLRTPTA